MNQKITLIKLKMLGYQADTAANRQEALLALEGRVYDLMLMDIQMPEMDGIEAYQAHLQMLATWSQVNSHHSI